MEGGESLGMHPLARIRRQFERIGFSVLKRLRSIAYLFAVLWAVVAAALRPSTWNAPVRDVLYRQILFTGIDGMFLAGRFSLACGILVVVQTELWGTKIGTARDALEEVMYRTVLRDLAPLVANLVVIGRSGTAMAIEMATMKLNGELEVLESQGVDPLKYLVVPRVISTAICVFSLAIVVVFMIVGSGLFAAFLLGVLSTGPGPLLETIGREINREDAVFFVTKTLLIGLMVGVICVTTGLQARHSPTEIPVVASQSGVRALSAVFLMSALLPVIFYNKLLLIELF
jgi:phospholipid/cholesterol/gamma-HCH transport system permease protein